MFKSIHQQIKDMERIAKNEKDENKARLLIKVYLREQSNKVPEWMLDD